MSFIFPLRHCSRLLLLNNQIPRFFSVSSAVLQNTSTSDFERYYTKKHEWLNIIDKNSNEVRIGISDYAQQALGEVVYCELPTIGTKYKKSDSFATLESVKAVSDCYMPIDGEITEINEKLKEEASLINKSPYEQGWLAQAKVDDKNIKDIEKSLMNEKQYQQYIKGELDNEKAT
ncbi:unnamed protein product [Didymodactylos carnosus]|uniref:Glycine cleavage system H protein n=1 Tax=Didymodactylos carnosus TaxID=1234261 RepID=A0A814BB57_9BILA|nr:unnamed protein product [Didymodactylos carnosus]CAF0924541.1 unnamed protein product [Didymodactylos carnosus]CAF3630677.1 unnamed protein product [Didymodactylos carnosus]CAF3703428.1 unnamed protein product [Didymodactylos carnosus]